ncbi:MAG TPA: aldo/keto reductase [Steroidobacteraceae bacterium]|jgi:2,5-diketo-D-gluconate reductase A|nr:aldo/keto reductase [Steroidobacteraceae bacterium]
MNAVVQQDLRAVPEPGASSLLAPESCRILPSGNRMPLLGLGTWHLTTHTVETLCKAFELGFRMIDTAADYHTQRGIGDAIKACGLDRDEFFVITKVEPEEDTCAATLKNLAQLKLNYVDLVLIHRPPRQGAGEQAWQGLRRAKREGFVHDIGVSSYPISCIEDLVYRTGEMPAVNQIEWSPFGHSPSMLDFCRDNEIVIQAWSPLTRATRLNDDKVGAMAARYGKTPAQLLIRWNLQLGVVPLPKANHVQHLRENLNVFDFEISHTDMAKLNGLNEHYSALKRLQYL